MGCALTKIRRGYIGTGTQVDKAINATKFKLATSEVPLLLILTPFEPAGRRQGTIKL